MFWSQEQPQGYEEYMQPKIVKPKSENIFCCKISGLKDYVRANVGDSGEKEYRRNGAYSGYDKRASWFRIDNNHPEKKQAKNGKRGVIYKDQ